MGIAKMGLVKFPTKRTGLGTSSLCGLLLATLLVAYGLLDPLAVVGRDVSRESFSDQGRLGKTKRVPFELLSRTSLSWGDDLSA